MEKIKTNSPEYKLIKKSYEYLIEDITREKKYDKFIGGLPITLERKDIFTILSKDISGKYRYSVTQKVDGTRLLLFVNYKNDGSGTRNITFIDRNNDFYTLKNTSREQLPDYDGQMLLIDGELVTYSTNDEVISPESKFSDVKMFSFMAFDILYGPEYIEYSGPPNFKKLNIGQHFSMTGPEGGKRWSYERRYNILHQLLVPNELNNNRPPLSLAFKECKWCIPEIKPLYSVNQLNTKQKLYGSNISFFQKNLKEFRTVFYEKINTIIRIQPKYSADLFNVTLDGLIFTPFNSEYVIGGPWKKFLNIQYKWKPIEEQSIDFAIYKEKNRYLLKVKKGPELTTFNIYKNNKFTPAELTEETAKELLRIRISNGTIGEFVYDKMKNQFKLLRMRIDKSSPNSINTAKNVMNAIKNPVDLEIIKQFLILDKLKPEKLTPLLRYMTKSQMLRCAIKNNEIALFSDLNNLQINKLLDIYKQNNSYEFELRFGIIEKTRFQTNLPFNLYNQIQDIISTVYPNVKYETNVYYDMYSFSTRTRYLYLDQLDKLVPVASIKKETIENVNFDIKYLYNLDVRFGLSNEKRTFEKIMVENAKIILKKIRTTFNFDIFSLDCTEINKIIKEKHTGKLISEASKFQIELELKNNQLPNEEIIKKISLFIKNIFGSINS